MGKNLILKTSNLRIWFGRLPEIFMRKGNEPLPQFNNSIYERNTMENLDLINESWYIGDNEKKIKEFRNIYDPKTNKYLIENEKEPIEWGFL